jgi:hypothetical protein
MQLDSPDLSAVRLRRILTGFRSIDSGEAVSPRGFADIMQVSLQIAGMTQIYVCSVVWNLAVGCWRVLCSRDGVERYWVPGGRLQRGEGEDELSNS